MRTLITAAFMMFIILAFVGPAGAAWQPFELIDADTGNNAHNPQIALDGDGNALAVWYQWDGSNWRIYANRWDGSAWGTAELIDVGSGNSASSPQIALDGAGNALAVWQQWDGANDRIYANRWDGSDWGTAELIDADPDNDAYNPQIALDGAGNALAVWQQWDGANDRIYANRWDGSAWGTAELIDAGSGNSASSPQIALDGDGNALAVWEQSDGSKSRIYAALYVTHFVTPSVGANGNIDPDTAQTVNGGETTQFTVTPDAGFTASVGGTCGGALAGDTYTTDPVTADCTVVATFAPVHEDDTSTGSGTATASTSVSGNSDTACGITSSGFVPVPVVPPPGLTLPHGMYGFTVENCTPGFTVNMVIEYPDPIPAGAQYWKYHAGTGWYTLPATISGNQVSFTVTDGGAGDHTGAQNGTITDPGGIGIMSTHAPGTATAIPTLSQWAMILLILLMAAMAAVSLRQRG